MASAPLCAIKLGPINCFCVQQAPADLTTHEMVRDTDDAPAAAAVEGPAAAAQDRPKPALRPSKLGTGDVTAPTAATPTVAFAPSGAGLQMSEAEEEEEEAQSPVGLPLTLGGTEPRRSRESEEAAAATAAALAAAAAVSQKASAPVVADDDAGDDADPGVAPIPSRAVVTATPDVPNAPLDFINVIVAKLWPSIDRAVYGAVRTTVMPIVRDIIGVPFVGRKLKILSFSLGPAPARVGPMKLVSVPHPSGKGIAALEIRIGLCLDCQTDISFGFSSRLSLGINHLSIEGNFVVRLSPLVPIIPVVGGVSMYFLDPPDIKIGFTGVGKLAEAPKISDIVRTAIDMSIAQSLVLPNGLPTPLLGEDQGVDKKELSASVLGVLIVTAIRAEKLVPKDPIPIPFANLAERFMPSHVCDPYVQVNCSDDSWKSSTVTNTLSPVWSKNDEHSFFVYDMDQRIRIEVWDDDVLQDTLVGMRTLTIYEAMRASEQGIDLQHPSKPHSNAGKLFLQFQWCSLMANNLGECRDVIVHVKFDDACIPAVLFGQKKSETIAIKARVKNIGERFSGRKKVEYIEKMTAFVTVYDQLLSMRATATQLFEMAERAEGQKLPVTTVTGISRLSPDMIKEHNVDEEARALMEEEATRVFSLETVLSMPIPRDSVDFAEVELVVVDGDLETLGTFTVPVASVKKDLVWRGEEDGNASFTCTHKTRIGPVGRRKRRETLKVMTTISIEGLQINNPARSHSTVLVACEPPPKPTVIGSGPQGMSFNADGLIPGLRQAIAESNPVDEELINTLLRQLWPTVDQAVRTMFETQILTAVKEALPSALRGIKVNSFSIGKVPPKIGPIKIFPGPRGTGQLELRIGVLFQSEDLSISLGLLGGFAPVGVSAVHFSGELVVRLQPILDQVPVLGGIVIFFLDPPALRLKFSGLAQAAEIVRIRGLVRTAINSAIADALVLPHVIAVPLVFDEEIVDLKKLQSPTPRGVLRVTVQRATNLKGQDWGPTKNTSDPYVIIMLGSDRLQTDVVKKTCDPVWKNSCNNTRDFLVYDEAQKLLIEIYDYDTFTPDDVIGSVLPMRTVAEAVQLSEDDKPFPLKVTDALGQLPELPEGMGVPEGGNLYMLCQWMQLVPGKAGRDGLIILAEVDEVIIPQSLGSAAALCVEIAGQKKTTPAAYPPAGSVAKAVEEELERAVERCKAHDLDVTTAAEVTSLPEEKVRKIYGVKQAMSAAEKERSDKRVKRLATHTLHIESGLYITVPADIIKDPSTEIQLSLVDPKGKRLVGTSLTLGDLMSQPGLKKAIRRMSSEEFSAVKVEVDVTAVGMQYAELVAP